MKKFSTDKIDDLADVFCAVMGGRPESIAEIKDFMQQSPLKQLFFTADMERIIEFDGFFADETVDAVYALLPTKIPLNENQSWVMTPQAFAKLNQAKMQKSASRVINISFPRAMNAYLMHFDAKIKDVAQALQEQKKKRLEYEKKQAEEQERINRRVAEILAREEAERKAREEAERKAREEAERKAREEAERKAQEEVKKAEKREKNRLRMQQYRAEHPEKRKSYYKKLETLPAKERRRQRKANNKRNAVYREKNRERLRQSHNERRARLKAENPELLKALDKQHNEQANRKASCHKYYLKHKEEMAQKARENPMVKVYKQRYKIKQRLKKTGPVIASLLQGIIDSKSRN